MTVWSTVCGAPALYVEHQCVAESNEGLGRLRTSLLCHSAPSCELYMRLYHTLFGPQHSPLHTHFSMDSTPHFFVATSHFTSVFSWSLEHIASSSLLQSNPPILSQHLYGWKYIFQMRKTRSTMMTPGGGKRQ